MTAGLERRVSAKVIETADGGRRKRQSTERERDSASVRAFAPSPAYDVDWLRCAAVAC